MIVEQLGSQEYRMRYEKERNVFVQTAHKSLGYARGFVGIYGWIVGSGTPPGKHLDVMAPTRNSYELGDVVPIRIVGCFKRNDNDNKFVAVEANRTEKTFGELPESEVTMLHALYPEVHEGEAWLEAEEALGLLGRWDSSLR